MQDWAYCFLLIVPVDSTEAEPTTFRRGGILAIIAADDDENGPGLLSKSREGGKSRWNLYSKLIELL